MLDIHVYQILEQRIPQNDHVGPERDANLEFLIVKYGDVTKLSKQYFYRKITQPYPNKRCLEATSALVEKSFAL